MKKLLALVAAVTMLSTLALAGGLEVGDSVSAFYVKDVTGPAAGGAPLCYRCRYGDRPVVSIFTRDVNANVAALIKEVDGVVATNPDDRELSAFVVLLTEDPDAQEATLKKVAEETKISHTPLTTFKGAAGPKPYQISGDAEVTVMMWVNGKLQVNEAFKKGEFTKDKIASVVGKTKQILN